MIDAVDLVKHYDRRRVLDNLSFQVLPGRVTGLLGPNGAGKSTAMRILLGLSTADSGTATVNGRPYEARTRPLTEVGALVDGAGADPRRSARAHLGWLARANGLPRRRADEVLELVGLATVAGHRVGGYSLGMRQRLGLAAALLGDPGVLVLDEPVNGLDVEGTRWLRDLLRRLAHEGRTVLLSSHHIAELAVTADHVLVIGRGRLLADRPIDELANRTRLEVRMRCPRIDEFARILANVGGAVSGISADTLVSGLSAERIGDLAAAHGIAVHELTPTRTTLEEAYLSLTGQAVEYAARNPDRTTVEGSRA
ncbi:ABC transporter ATP-binding protein [Kitasatospora sp. NPDC089913]|uniref:ABC transporter ATP-binding protein n=1 Tax=Kitasatospora sp. NPDC089913 TaxID=3364080 RepID=UPI003810821C